LIRDALPFTIRDGVAKLDFSGDDPPERFDVVLTTALRWAFADESVRRVEVRVPAPDQARRQALHRAGFRLEGVLKARLVTPTGRQDQCCYALLRDDVAHGREAFTAVMNTVTARKRVIAHLLLTDANDQVCVLETTFKPDFELPGGILEPGESPRVGLLRECAEELEFQPGVGRLLVVDWLAPYLGWEDAVELIFDGGQCDSPELLHPDGHEIRTVHWLPAPAAIDTMAPFAQGRLQAALAARRLGQTSYLEAGHAVV
jgi:8-oxo-dGTP diphosphatase